MNWATGWTVPGLRLSFHRLFVPDLSGRARALQSMVKADSVRWRELLRLRGSAG